MFLSRKCIHISLLYSKSLFLNHEVVFLIIGFNAYSMRKIFVILTLLTSLVVTSAYAQKQLVVELKDGGTVTYILSDEPVVTFQDSKVCVKSEKAQAEYERSQVSRFYFEETATGVENVKDGLRFEYVS